MGRWAQYRHRGRGGSAPAAFLLPPPSAEDFYAFSETANIAITMQTPCPEGADEVGVRYRKVGDEAWTAAEECQCDDTSNVTPLCDLGDSYEVQIRWLDNTMAPISDWSNSNVVLCAV